MCIISFLNMCEKFMTAIGYILINYFIILVIIGVHKWITPSIILFNGIKANNNAVKNSV